jgi:hypothetical protein
MSDPEPEPTAFQFDPETNKDAKALTMKDKTASMRIVETTRIGIPIAVIVLIVSSLVGFLYTNVMNELARVNVKLTEITNSTLDDKGKLIEMKVELRYMQDTVDDLQKDVETLTKKR